jgi:hypothetical protein
MAPITVADPITNKEVKTMVSGNRAEDIEALLRKHSSVCTANLTLLMDAVVHMHLLRALDCGVVTEQTGCIGACRWDTTGAGRCRSKYDPVFGTALATQLARKPKPSVGDEMVLNVIQNLHSVAPSLLETIQSIRDIVAELETQIPNVRAATEEFEQRAEPDIGDLGLHHAWMNARHGVYLQQKMVLNAIDGDKGLRQAMAVLRALVDAISPAMLKAVKKWAHQNPQLENVLQSAKDAEEAGTALLEQWERDRFRVIPTNHPRSGAS